MPGWGEGELWIGRGLVLANDFRFSLDGPALGGGGSPSRWVAIASTAVPAPTPTAATTATSATAATFATTAPRGATKPPSNTVASTSERVGNGSVARVSDRVDPDDVVARVCTLLAGEAVELSDVPLDLDPFSPFQRTVTTVLRQVPRGEVVTYGELAALAGRPRAQRAAGSVCARNPFMFLVPCHRVVAANGIGSYGSAGTGIKRRLLALEGVEL